MKRGWREGVDCMKENDKEGGKDWKWRNKEKKVKGVVGVWGT